MDTIFALATAQGRAGVAVVRISGPEASSVLDNFACAPVLPRRASLQTLRWDGDVLDEALVLRFDAPNTFTGEDIVELQLHGSRAVVQSTLRALSRMPGLRSAEAGEFTRRALENDRLDLAQVEGLADLIDADTEAQRKQAFRVFGGALGEKVESWRRDLIRAAALLEATIDFVDEDVPVDVYPEVRGLLAAVSESLSHEVAGVAVAERIRDGFEVAIVGPPNAGKSTLLNALAGRDAALTSDIAGTTRDVIEVHMDLGGLPVTILDTAGMRDSDDVVEAMGIERALARARSADLRVILVPEGEAPVMEAGVDDIVLRAKDDSGVAKGVSGHTGVGIDTLVGRVTEVLSVRSKEAGVAIRERHRVAMERAIGALGIAVDRVDSAPDLTELIAEELRVAARALDALVGRVDVEHLLDEIFTSFCIGK